MTNMFSWFQRRNGHESRVQSPEETLLEAEAVSFAVEAQRILEEVTLSSRKGEFVGLVGPNGAGKTTLIKCISGLLTQTEGSVSLGGRDLALMSPRQVAQVVAHLPQNTSIDFGFTTMEVVLMGRNPHLGPFQLEGAGDLEIAQASMAFTGTDWLASRNVNTLSGGERQRVLIARALAQEPSLLLLDEPTANLDIQHQLQIMGLIRRLVDGGMAALAAMHDLNMASAFCDRLYLMKNGKLVASGRPEEVLKTELLDDVFGVTTAVDTHPVTGRPRIDFFVNGNPRTIG